MVTVLHLKRRDGARASVIVDLAGKEAVQRACDALQWNVSDVQAEVAKEVPCYILEWTTAEIEMPPPPRKEFLSNVICKKCHRHVVQCSCGT